MNALKRIELWSANGAPHTEIRARLAERTDEECMLACAILKSAQRLNFENMRDISELAVALRASGPILDAIETNFREQAAGLCVQVPRDLMELTALAVEHHVRIAIRLFPE